MKTSPTAVSQIAAFEGCRLVPYNDLAGNATVGYGHLIHLGPLTGAELPLADEAAALTLFAQDLDRKAECYVLSFVTVVLNQSQFDALVSFTFNLGPGALRTLLSASGLNSGLYHNVPPHLVLYNKARVNGVLAVEPGLTKRRQWEARLFATPE